MAAVLKSIQDARSYIDKMSRKELEYLARYEKRDDIVDGMPAELIKLRFQAVPPANPPRPIRAQLGSQQRLVVPPYEQWVKYAYSQEVAPAPEEQAVEEVTAASDLEKQWLADQQKTTDFNALTFQKLRQECKARGIKFKRTDKKAVLVEKLDGQDAS